MLTIWKFPIPSDPGRFDLTMPQGARILHLQVQDGIPHLWAELCSESASEVRQFAVIGTGRPVPPGASYLGTWQDSPFVWHLYEKTA